MYSGSSQVVYYQNYRVRFLRVITIMTVYVSVVGAVVVRMCPTFKVISLEALFWTSDC